MKNNDNKLIEVQDIIFQEMKRLGNDDFFEEADNSLINTEFERATAIYNTSTGFIKTLNTNLKIRQLAKREETTYEEIKKQLGL